MIIELRTMIDPDASSSRLPSPLDGICSPYKIQSFTHAASSTVRPPTSSPPGHGVAKAKRRSSTRIRPRIPMFADECPCLETGVPIPSVSGMPSTEVVNTRAGSSRHRSLSQPAAAAAVAAKETMKSCATVPNENAQYYFQHLPPKRLNLDHSLRDVGNICASAPSAGSAIGHTSKPSSSLHAAPARSEPRRGSHIDRCSSAAVSSPSSTSPASSTGSLNEKSAAARKKMPASIELGQPRADSCRILSGEQQRRAESIRRRRKSASCVGDQAQTPTSIGTTSDGNTSREDQRLFDSGNASGDTDEESSPPPRPAGSPPPLPDSPRGGTMNPISPFAPFKSPKCASLQYNPAPPYTPGAPLPLAAWLDPAPATAGASAARACPSTRALPAERSTPSPPPPSSAGIGRGRCNSSSAISSSSHTPASATTTIADEDNGSINYSGTEDWHHCNDADDEASCQSSSHWSVGSSSSSLSSFSSGSFFSPQLVAQLQKHNLYDHICLRTLRLANVGSLEELSNVPVTDLMAGGFNKIQARKLSDIATTAEAGPTAAARGNSNREQQAAAAKAFQLSAVEKDGVQLDADNQDVNPQTATATAARDSPPSQPLPLAATARAAPNEPAGPSTATKHRKRHTKQRRTRKKQPKEDSNNEEAVATLQSVFVVASTPVSKKSSPNVNQQPRLHKSSSADDVLVSSSSSTSPFSTSSSGSSPDHNVAPSSRALLSSSKMKGRQFEGTAPVRSTSYQMMRGWRYTHFGARTTSTDDRGDAPSARADTGAPRTHPHRPARSRSADDALASSFETAAAATSPADDHRSTWRQRVSTPTKGFGIHRDARNTTPRPCASPLQTYEVSPVAHEATFGSQLRCEDGVREYGSNNGVVSGQSEVFYVKDAPGEAVPVPRGIFKERTLSAFDNSKSPSSPSRRFPRSRAVFSKCYRFYSCSNRTTVERSVKSPPTPPPTPPSTPPRIKGAAGTGDH